MMTNLTRWIIFVGILSLCFSCNSLEQNDKGNPEPNYNPYILKPGRTFKAEPTVINLDSLEKPDPIPLKREIVNLGKQVTYPRKTNIQPAPDPTFYPITSKVIPKDSVPEPKKVSLEIKEVPLKWSAWEPANLIFKEGGQYNFSYLDVNRGLKSNLVHAMLEDRRGNIWIGTQGGGVSIWDGKGFRHLGKEEGLASDDVVDLMEDRAGNIWMAHPREGVSIWNGKTIKQVFVNAEKILDITGPPNNIWSLLEDQAGNIWMGTGSGNGVYKWEAPFQKQEVLHYTTNQGLSGNFVFDLLEDESGMIWLGSLWRGLVGLTIGVCSWDGYSFTQYIEPTGSLKQRWGKITQDQSGNIWLGTSKGVGKYHYDKKRDQTGVSIHLPYDRNIAHLTSDSKGRLWTAWLRTGVTIWDSTILQKQVQIQSFKQSEGLSNNQTAYILEDSYGNHWIGSSGGVSILRENAFEHFAQNNELSIPGVMGIVEDHERNIRLGNNLSTWSNTHYTIFKNLPDILKSEVRTNAIAKDHQGNIWLTFWSGSEKAVFYWKKSPLGFDQLIQHTLIGEERFIGVDRAILEDSQRNLWFIGTLNIFMGKPNEKGELDTLSVLMSEKDKWLRDPTGIYEDSDERMWITSAAYGFTFIQDKNFH